MVSRFVWHDLMAPDVESAKRFYGELFGWKFDADKASGYVHIKAGEQHIGGMMKLDSKMGAPPHWLPYVSVDSVDKAVERIGKHGGRVVMPKQDIPNTGSFAVAMDPKGAAFAPFHSARPEEEPHGRPGAYTFCWDELMTSDTDGAAKFYAAVFGWGVEHMEMPGFGRYTLLKRPGVKDDKGMERNAGGIMKLPQGVPHPFWLSYVAVQSCDQTVEKAKRLGATVTAPPMDIPDVGRFAVTLDPQKAAIAVLQPKMG